jgi:6-phosphogluconolactonase
MPFFISTHRGVGEENFYALEFDDNRESLSAVSTQRLLSKPTYIINHPSLPVLYTAGDTASGGIISAVNLREDLQDFSVMGNHIPQIGSGGDSPCHLAIDHEATTLCISNYRSGTFATVRLSANGMPITLAQQFSFQGVGAHPIRQQRSHIHSSVFSPTEDYVLVADLGLDRIVLFACTRTGGCHLTEIGHVAVRPGSGPRYMRFSADGRFLYVVMELSNEVAVYMWQSGSLRLMQTVSTLPDQAHDTASIAADIQFGINEEYVYTSNRGHESITLFLRNAENGLLSDAKHYSCHGKHPRSFVIDEARRWMVIANVDSNNVVICPIDEDSGGVGEPVCHAEIQKPMCVLCAPKR